MTAEYRRWLPSEPDWANRLQSARQLHAPVALEHFIETANRRIDFIQTLLQLLNAHRLLGVANAAVETVVSNATDHWLVRGGGSTRTSPTRDGYVCLSRNGVTNHLGIGRCNPVPSITVYDRRALTILKSHVSAVTSTKHPSPIAQRCGCRANQAEEFFFA